MAYLRICIQVPGDDESIAEESVEVYSYQGACDAGDIWCIDHFPSIIEKACRREFDLGYVLDNFEANLVELGVCNEETGELDRECSLESIEYSDNCNGSIDLADEGDSTELEVILRFSRCG
jgi:hypothetical protein